MKLLIVSDIHGNSEKFRQVVDFMLDENIEQMIILGDLFNNYYDINTSTKEISDLLWKVASKVTIIKGNCDTKYDEKFLPVNFLNHYHMNINNKNIIFFHGDQLPPAGNYQIYCQGHTHICKIDKKHHEIYFNPGSLSRPRDYTIGTFGIISNYAITIYDLNYKVIDEIKI